MAAAAEEASPSKRTTARQGTRTRMGKSISTTGSKRARGVSPGPGRDLLLVEGGDERSTRGRGDGVGGQADARDVDGQRARGQRALEHLLEAARLRRAAGEHDGDRPLRARQLVGLGERRAQLLHQRLDEVLVVDAQRLLVLVLRDRKS